MREEEVCKKKVDAIAIFVEELEVGRKGLYDQEE